MQSADTLLVGNRQTPGGSSGSVSVDTDSNQKAIPKHKHSGSDGEVNGEVSTTLLEEDPFSSEASKILFDGVDELRRCGAAVDLDLPQLVIVGGQSAGKSSLLQSLTDIPFPVGDGLCTRFATRIISRRSAPDSSDFVKVSIEKGDSEPFRGQADDQREPFNPHVNSITAEVFADILEQASKYMGITDQRGSKKSNFSSDILRIELHGPTRSHFGILDVPGIFHALTETVTDEDMERVTAMVTSHMKKPENVIICVAPATGDLAMQQIFTLAKKHAESSRVVGVFTKCDQAPDPKNIVRIVRDNLEIGLHNGWFVVQNRPKNPSLAFNQEEAEKATFRRDPWTDIPAKQRGTPALKKFLAITLSSRIRTAFPEVQRKIKELLAKETDYLGSLGEERLSQERRREYLLKIVGRYQELARDSLSNPERLPLSAMKLRGLTKTAMEGFANNMKLKGHLHNFADVSVSESTVDPNDLYKEIRTQIAENRGEELNSMTNPAVMRPLFTQQTSKWEAFGQAYLEEVVKMSKKVSLLILDYVFSEFAVPHHTASELKNTIDEFETQSLNYATLKLRNICHRNSTFPLVTTDENFKAKVKIAQSDRFIAALMRYREKNPPASFIHAYADKEVPKLVPEMLKLTSGWVVIDTNRLNQLFDEVHPRATRNTEDEIHDLLKAYYEVALETFKTDIHRLVEEFLKDPKGLILGLSDEYVLNLHKEQVDILGGEDEFVVISRKEAMEKIKRLQQATKIAGDTRTKSMQLER
ncbi:hypothetical protein V501_05960 [Pseudogymnoascus sp. VKM F-4519 (FW-2642)]|nr:hypothetical protein V501_05960 [Pseudogymnoascus sp. VKM F-4519 (FW-2642)]